MVHCSFYFRYKTSFFHDLSKETNFFGLWLYHGLACLAHASLGLATFSTEIFDIKSLDPRRINDTAYAWLTYRCPDNTSNCGTIYDQYKYSTFTDFVSRSSWEDNCQCTGTDSSFCSQENNSTGCSVVALESTNHNLNVNLVFYFRVYFACSCAQHLFVVLYFQKYLKSVCEKHTWFFRWVEYSISAACMTIIVIAIQGGATADGITMAATITAVTMPFGYIIELVNGLLKDFKGLKGECIEYTYKKTDCDRTADDTRKTKDRAESVAYCEPKNPEDSVPTNDSEQTTRHTLKRVGITALASGFLLQFFGLWFFQFIVRFYDTLLDNEFLYKNCGAASGDSCETGPPSWVQYAVFGLTIFYVYFGFVMVAVHFSVVPEYSWFPDELSRIEMDNFRSVFLATHTIALQEAKNARNPGGITFSKMLKNIFRETKNCFYLWVGYGPYYTVLLPLCFIGRAIILVPCFILKCLRANECLDFGCALGRKQQPSMKRYFFTCFCGLLYTYLVCGLSFTITLNVGPSLQHWSVVTFLQLLFSLIGIAGLRQLSWLNNYDENPIFATPLSTTAAECQGATTLGPVIMGEISYVTLSFLSKVTLALVMQMGIERRSDSNLL